MCSTFIIIIIIIIILPYYMTTNRLTDCTNMELDRKFQMATACRSLTIGSLGTN